MIFVFSICLIFYEIIELKVKVKVKYLCYLYDIYKTNTQNDNNRNIPLVLRHMRECLALILTQ